MHIGKKNYKNPDEKKSTKQRTERVRKRERERGGGDGLGFVTD